MKRFTAVVIFAAFSLLLISCKKKAEQDIGSNVTLIPSQAAEDNFSGVNETENENPSEAPAGTVTPSASVTKVPDADTDNLPYHITETSYFSDDVIKIYYPQLEGVNDQSIQDRINVRIKTAVMDYTEGFDSKQADAALEISYKITRNSNQLLSILFLGYKNTPDAAYPSSFAFTENFNLGTGDEVKLSDMVQPDEGFINRLKEKGTIKYFYVNNRSIINDESFSEADKSLALKDYIFGSEASADFTKADGEADSKVSSYYTEDSLGLSIPTVHAYGDHIEFEIKYQDILNFMKKDNFIWKDFPEITQETASLEITPTEAPKQETNEINEEEIIKNTNYVPGFKIQKEQSFWVDLENWGKVYFISASGEGEFDLDSLYMYLADKDSNILYEFPYFYGNGMLYCGTRAVSFQDVNKDGLKDIIVIAGYMTGIGPTGAEEFPVAGIYFQKDKAFVTLPELDEEINSSGNNETVDMILEYLKNVNISLDIE